MPQPPHSPPQPPPDHLVLPVADTVVRDGVLQAVLREVEPGLLVVPAYTSVPALVAGCGPAQAWAVVPRSAVEQLRAAAGAVAVLLDVLVEDAPSSAAPR